MPLSTIDRGRGGQLGGPGPPTYQRSRTIHTPPQEDISFIVEIKMSEKLNCVMYLIPLERLHPI